MRTFKSLLPLSLLIAAALIAGCGGSDSTGSDAGDSADPALSVVATTTIVADWVREVSGDRVEVTQILQPNSDPHGFEPRPDDVAATAEADLIFYSGLGLDSWVDDLISGSGSSAATVDLSQGLPNLIRSGDDHGHDGHGDAEEDHGQEDEAHGDSGEQHEGHDHDGEFDPHWWQDPRNAEAAAQTIATALAGADEGNPEVYREAAGEYRGQLARIDRQIESCLAQIPARDRKLVTDHEAFAYLADRYRLELTGTVIPALTTQAQPSAADLRDLAAVIEREQVPAIFPEQALDPGLADTIAAQTGASADNALYGDALGPEGSDADTYLGMMATNAESLADGLSRGEAECDML